MEHHRFTLPSIIIEKSKSPLRCWQVEEPLAIQKQRDCSLISSLIHFPGSSPGAPGGMGMDDSGSGVDSESESESCCEFGSEFGSESGSTTSISSAPAGSFSWAPK